MNREQDIAKNSFIFTAGRIAAQFIAFLLLPLYSELLTPEDYGTADLINTVVFLALPFVAVQIDTALFRFTVDCRDSKDKQKELFSTVIVINLIQILGSIALYLAVRPFIGLVYKDFIILNVVLIIPVNTFLQYMRGLGMNVKYAAAVFITSFSALIMNIILVAVFMLGVTGIIISSAASQFLTLIYALIAVHPSRDFSLQSFSSAKAKSLLKYSLPLVPNQLAWWIMIISDRLVISGALGVAANGIYSMSNKFSSIYTSVTDSINLSWMESTSLHFNDKDGKEYVSGMLNRLFTLFASGCFMFIAVIPYAFQTINISYSDSYMHIPILLTASLCQATVGIFSSVLIATKRTKSIAVTSIIAAAVNFFIDIAFVNRIGIYAGSLSTLTAFAVLAILRSITVKKTFNVDISIQTLIPLTIWGGAVISCYYLRNPYINILSVIASSTITIIANRRIIGTIFTFIKNRKYKVCHQKRIQTIYGKMEEYVEDNDVVFNQELIRGKKLNDFLTYKDESWNYIHNLRSYQELLAKGSSPDWEDNDCYSNKYSFDGNSIQARTEAMENNWLCFYINEELPDSYELSYDICIRSVFTEVQVAFNYIDLGNRYRFMIKDNKECLFEAVYEGDFLDSFTKVPYSLTLGLVHRICVRVTKNIYEFFVDGIKILGIKENNGVFINGNRVCLILWEKDDTSSIDCDISNISIRGM